MTPVSRILSVLISSFFLLLVLALIRSNRLKEKYALLWLFTGFIILALSIFKGLLFWIVRSLGIILPINGILFFAVFFIIIINLHFSVIISDLSEQNKKIVQKLALLEIELQGIKKDDRG